MSINVTAYYCELVKGGVSEIRREIVTQDVSGCDRPVCRCSEPRGGWPMFEVCSYSHFVYSYIACSRKVWFLHSSGVSHTQNHGKIYLNFFPSPFITPYPLLPHPCMCHTVVHVQDSKIYLMLKLFPNISIALEQIYSFKTGIIAAPTYS